ncbi:MAG TPA: hypothetical protein VL461_03940, partial [Dictyobacter sp.]|nr:hypothetical protein [Dictyobacter sp.]
AHVHILSVLAAPPATGTLQQATVRLGTINPTPLLLQLQEEGIQFSFGLSSSDEHEPDSSFRKQDS